VVALEYPRFGFDKAEDRGLLIATIGSQEILLDGHAGNEVLNLHNVIQEGAEQQKIILVKAVVKRSSSTTKRPLAVATNEEIPVGQLIAQSGGYTTLHVPTRRWWGITELEQFCRHSSLPGIQ
jgi:hypothetical protein